ncbi:MAG: nucleotide sugar dehydrogenase [Bacteroidota bacterium]
MKKIGILGIGKLGLCFALQLEKAGYDVIGFDKKPLYVDSINAKSFRSSESGVTDSLKEAKNLIATTSLSAVIQKDIDLLFLFVNTPKSSDGGYDHRLIEGITDDLIKFGEREKTVHLVLGCTTMPGYCDQLSAKMAPYNYQVSYNPEFIAQGSIMSDLASPDMVLIGEANQQAGDLIETVYRNICTNHPQFNRMDRLSAEICKLAVNCFLTTKIAFANMIGDLAIASGANSEKILNALGSDNRIGPKFLRYGFGYGGPCLSRDNRALSLFAEHLNIHLHISAAADISNNQHLDFQFNQMLKEFDENAVIYFNSVTYKPESELLDASQQLALAVMLAKAGRKVKIVECKAVLDQIHSRYPGLFILEERD